MYIRRKVWGIGIAIVAFFYFGIGFIVTPRVNPSPSQRIRIHGDFPYQKGLFLSFRSSFYSNNPVCKLVGRAFLIFPTENINRRVAVDLPIKQIAGNQYESEVVIDHFSPGFCDWGYGGMAYEISGGKQTQNQTGSFYALGPIPRKTSNASLACSYLSSSLPSLPQVKDIHVFCLNNVVPDIDVGNPPRSSELNFLWKDE